MICKRCKVDQDISNYYKSTKTTSGYRGTCKSCAAEQAASRYKKTKNFVGHNQANLPMPPQDWLKDNYDYHKDGGFIRLKPRGSQKAGSLLFGKKEKTGYMRMPINYDVFSVHRVIWKWHHGDEPEFIDHINGNRSDNRIENLRPVTKAENSANRALSKNNTSGFFGVKEYNYKGVNKFAWAIRHKGKKHQGYTKTIGEAVEKYIAVARELNPVLFTRRIEHNEKALAELRAKNT